MRKSFYFSKIQQNGKHLRVNVSIGERLLNKIDRAAIESGISRSAYLAKAAVEKMTRDTFSAKD